jgi:hypothetical protein
MKTPMSCAECERLKHLIDLAYGAFLVAYAAQQAGSDEPEALHAATAAAREHWQNLRSQKATHDRDSHPKAPLAPRRR